MIGNGMGVGDDIEGEKGCFSLRRKRMGRKGKGLFACIDMIFLCGNESGEGEKELAARLGILVKLGIRGNFQSSTVL